MDRSHFVPYQIVNAIDGQRRGRPYSDESNRRVEKVMDQPANTSMTTSEWNRGINKRHENQLARYARGEAAWSDMSDGAKRRYHEQASAWKDIRRDFHAEQPALGRALDRFYNPGNKK